MSSLGIYVKPFFFFFNDTATTEIYTLSLHDALPIFFLPPLRLQRDALAPGQSVGHPLRLRQSDRKSTRLNSSHANISYAVFCLKKKNEAGRRTNTVLIHRHYPMP